MNRSLSETIKQLRVQRSVTQSELAAVVGVSVQAVSKWECGGTPDITLLPVIADFFEVSIDELFGRNHLDNVSIDNYLVGLLQSTPEHEQMYRATELCWAIFKGISGIPNVYNTPFTDTPDPNDDTCTRCRLYFDSGIAYANARKDAPSIFFMPEPKDGYNRFLSSEEEFVELFKHLSDRDFFDTMVFLYKRTAIPFSLEHICSNLGISANRMTEIIRQCMEFGWVEEETVELETGEIKIYRPILNGAFIGFLFFGTEIIQKYNLWYMSNSARSKPFLVRSKAMKKRRNKR